MTRETKMKISKVNFDNTARIKQAGELTEIRGLPNCKKIRTSQMVYDVHVGDVVEVVSTTCPIKKGVANTVKAVDHYNGMTRVLVNGIWLFGNEVKVVKNTETKSVLLDLTVKELRETAKKDGIKNTSKLNKAELISLLEYTYKT